MSARLPIGVATTYKTASLAKGKVPVMMKIQQSAAYGAAHIRRMMAANTLLRNALSLLLPFTMGGCAASVATGGATPSGTAHPSMTVAQLLDAARSSMPAQRAQYLLDAADLLLRQDKPEQAQQWLQTLGDMSLPPAQHARYQALNARLQLAQGKPEQALATLQDRQFLRDIDQLPVPEQTSISLLRAKTLALTGAHFASAQERVFVASLLSGKQRAQNQQEIWRALMYLDPATLRTHRDKAVNEQMRGWLDLALIAKMNQGNPEAQAQQLSQWSQQWVSHPAAGHLPGDLALLREVAANQPKQVALLLPLSGKLAAFGAAVRDGFMAAWYDTRERGGHPAALRIYDTEAGINIVQLYQQAVAEGAAMVVGPLDKQQVAMLYKQTLAVPTLALNRADMDAIAPANLYQFSLAPEDEARQIADIATQENHHRALIIAPEDEWRSREMQAFVQRLQSRGGEVVATALFDSRQNLSQIIKNALQIPRSEARAKELQNIISRNVEFTPRRRQDIDMVFMLAKSQQARSIKPLLNFYYAGDLPVYALSRIYNGYPNPVMDRDIDKVRFTEMPWILEQDPLKRRIIADQPQSRNYLRLYAMGVDSFHLYPRLQQLQKMSDSRVYGQTGYLTLTPQAVVQRELLLAEMRDGKPELVPTTLLRDDGLNAATERPVDDNGGQQ
jgi:outer membrane PBP1 activator LpoA protein